MPNLPLTAALRRLRLAGGQGNSGRGDLHISLRLNQEVCFYHVSGFRLNFSPPPGAASDKPGLAI